MDSELRARARQIGIQWYDGLLSDYKAKQKLMEECHLSWEDATDYLEYMKFQQSEE